MATKLRIIQIDKEEIVIKAATDKIINEAKKAMAAGGMFTVEKRDRSTTWPVSTLSVSK